MSAISSACSTGSSPRPARSPSWPLPRQPSTPTRAPTRPTLTASSRRPGRPGGRLGLHAVDDPPARARPRPQRGRARNAGPAGQSRRAVAAWVAKPHVRAWLTLAPRLGGTDLRPYFTYSRDKLSLGVVASRLPPRLQELLLQVEAEVDPVRRAALDRVKELDPTERGQLVDELL